MVGLVITACACVYAQKSWELYGKVNGMVGDEIISMDLSGTTLWAATTWSDPEDDEAPLEGGVSLLDPGTGNFTTYRPDDGLAHKKVWTILIDGDKVWFGTPEGISLLDTTKLAELGPYDLKEAWTTFTFDLGEPGKIAKDIGALAKSGDTIWFGSNIGLGSMNTKTKEWSHFEVKDGLPAKKVQAIEIDGTSVWVGTDGGLAMYDTEKGEFTEYLTPSEGTGSDIINTIKSDGQSIWVGMRNGLFAMDKTTEKWTSYVEDVLPDIWIQDIALSEEEVWVATREGVVILNRAKNKWKVIDEKKGLASNDVRAIRLADDHIWFGTARGINKYNPGAAAAQLRQTILIIIVLVAVGAGAVIAKVKFFKPSPEELEKRKKAEEIREKRKERIKTGKPSWQLCGGTPQKELCGRCKYNSVKSGKLHCSKYDIDLE